MKKIIRRGVVPTVRQQALADEILKNQMRAPKDRLTKQKVALEAGYLTTAPMKADGVKVALAHYGLTEKLIRVALVDDIENKAGNRVAELRLGADILGITKRGEGEGNKTLIVVVSGQSATRYGVQVTPNGTPQSTG